MDSGATLGCVLVLALVLYVVWSFVAFELKKKRDHREILSRVEERKAREEVAGDARSATTAWQTIQGYFPFLKTPTVETLSGEAIREAIVKALYSHPHLGTFDGLPAPLLPADERRRHLYVVGKTGSGKSTFLEHLIAGDLSAGRGVGVIAPEGELFRTRLLALVPQSRRSDVIYFAPGHPDCPLSFNPLSVEKGDDALRAAEDLFTIFRRALSGDELGPRMQPILQNAFAALVGQDGKTLWDVKRMLSDSAFRSRVVKGIEDPYIREFWEATFPRFSKGADLPLLSRLDQFLRPQAVRRSLCRPLSSFSIRQALAEEKILFVDLFGLSEETRSLIGQMILSKFQLELMRREIAGLSPPPFFLYCDEFQTFAGIAAGVWRELLSRGRKYGLALTLANQFPAQLPHELQEEIFGNVNSIVSFGLGAKDAQVMRKEFLTSGIYKEEMRIEALPIEELLELRTGEAYGKFAGGRAVKLTLPPPLAARKPDAAAEVVTLSWQRYGAPLPIEAAPARESEEKEALPPEETRTESSVEERLPSPVEARPATPSPPPPASERGQKAPRRESLGRGGPEHQYLQELLKRFGEEKGFRSVIEEPILGGGSVDVVLWREGFRLACEISVTTSAEQEAGNVEKCFAAGFDAIAIISSKPRHLGKLKAALLKRTSPEVKEKLFFLSPEEIPAFLQSLPAPRVREETVGGYTVKVRYRKGDPEDEALRGRAVSEVIARSLGRLKK